MKPRISIMSDIVVGLEDLMLSRGNDVLSITFSRDASMVNLIVNGHLQLSTLKKIGNLTGDANPEFRAISEDEVQITLTNYLTKN